MTEENGVGADVSRPMVDKQEERDESANGRDESVPTEDDTDALSYDNPWLTVTEEETGTKPPLTGRLWQSHVQRPDAARSEQSPTPDPQTSRTPDPQTWHPQEVPLHVVTPLAGAMPTNINAMPTGNTPTGGKLPRLRVVGQLAQSYIVTEGEDGLYLVDQHAAHERILLERMVAALKARTPLSQHLLTPLSLELSPQELEAIEEYQSQLEQIGFKLESGNDGTIAISAVPDVLAKRMNAQSLHELLLELTAPESLGSTETWEERALANVACKAAIKANYFLTVSEMREMLEQLEQTQAPYSCCHGRPTMVHFSLSALQREFGRR